MPHHYDWLDKTPPRRARPRRRPRGCGGWAAYDGPCGAPDCPTCHPEWQCTCPECGITDYWEDSRCPVCGAGEEDA